MTNTFGGAAPPLVVPRIKPTCATPVWPGDTGSEEFQGFFKGLFNLRIKLRTTVIDLAMRGKLLSPAGGDGDGGSAGRNGGTRNLSLC